MMGSNNNMNYNPPSNSTNPNPFETSTNVGSAQPQARTFTLDVSEFGGGGDSSMANGLPQGNNGMNAAQRNSYEYLGIDESAGSSGDSAVGRMGRKAGMALAEVVGPEAAENVKHAGKQAAVVVGGLAKEAGKVVAVGAEKGGELASQVAKNVEEYLKEHDYLDAEDEDA